MFDVLIIAKHKYGEPDKVVVERLEDWRYVGYLPSQGNQPVYIPKRNIGYIGNQPVVYEHFIQHERGF